VASSGFSAGHTYIAITVPLSNQKAISITSVIGPYVPKLDLDVATKKYVDDAIAAAIAALP